MSKKVNDKKSVVNNKKTKEKKNILDKTKSGFKEFKENPKKTSIKALKKIRHSLYVNRLFVLFIVLNILNDCILRGFTLGISSVFCIDTILADLAFVALIGSFSYLFNEKGRFIYLLVTTLLLSLLCVLNSAYYTFYTSFSSISLLSTARFITDVGDAVVESVLQPKDLIYIIMPILFSLFHYDLKKYNKNYNKTEVQLRSRKSFLRSLEVGIVSLLVFCMTLSGTDVSRLTKQWNREYVVKKFGIYVYHVNDLVKSLEPKFAALFGYDTALKEFNEFYADTKAPEKNEYTGIFEGKNILVIHGESIQNFLIGLKFNGQEVTPNINKLANKGMYFNNFYSQVSIGTSSDTEFTFNTSLMPASIGTAFSDYADKEFISTPKLLKEKGYYTFAMHANNGEYWNRRVMHKNLGYDHLYAKDEYIIDEKIGLGLSDVSFLRQTIEKLKVIKEEHKNYYGTIITLSNHTPFSDTDKYGEFPVDWKETVTVDGQTKEISHSYMEGTKLGDYLKSAHYADYALGLFFEALEKEGLLDNTVIVFYGDHDARLPGDDFERLYNYDITTDEEYDEEDPRFIYFDSYRYELNRKVPFIIWSPEHPELNQTFDYTMGMYDVMPTLGNMFGFYNKYQLGHDIFNTKEDNMVIFPSGNWLTKDMYYNSQKEEYFVLSTSIVSPETIENNSKLTEKILTVSNDILVYDLIKNANINTSKVNENEIIKGN